MGVFSVRSVWVWCAFGVRLSTRNPQSGDPVLYPTPLQLTVENVDPETG